MKNADSRFRPVVLKGQYFTLPEGGTVFPESELVEFYAALNHISVSEAETLRIKELKGGSPYSPASGPINSVGLILAKAARVGLIEKAHDALNLTDVQVLCFANDPEGRKGTGVLISQMRNLAASDLRIHAWTKNKLMKIIKVLVGNALGYPAMYNAFSQMHMTRLGPLLYTHPIELGWMPQLRNIAIVRIVESVRKYMGSNYPDYDLAEFPLFWN